MIKVTIYKTKAKVRGYEISGHAGYAVTGKDIVCAAVSVLGINTVNAIEAYTNAKVLTDVDESGYLKVMLLDTIDDKAQVLLDAFSLGVQEIYNDYGKTYIHVEFEEV